MDEKDLIIENSVALNQFRNSIYELIVALKGKNYPKDEITKKIKEMGSNIAKNYFQFWKPSSKGLEEELFEIYKFIFGKKVKINTETPKEITITQKNCPFCKYIRDDAGIAGCNVIVGAIEKYSEDFDIPKLKGTVVASKTLGDKRCIHQFKY